MKNPLNALCALLLVSTGYACTEMSETFAQSRMPVLHGYLKTMPSAQFTKGFEEVYFDNLIHNRLNLAWQPSRQFSFAAEARNRLFYGETYKLFPWVFDLLEEDPGYVDLSKLWASGDGWGLHTIIDRLYIDLKTEKWQIRAGRQRINWGINMVSNPNDLFNTYSFFDFDYEERPGSDALRVQYFPDGMSRLELAASPARNMSESVVAGLYAWNLRGYDLQTLAGYFRNRLALGGGWAGSIKTTGFKGEFTWFYDLEETPGVDRGNLVASVSFDHLFSNSLYGLVEFLYNGGYNRQPANFFLLTQALRADNIFLSEYAATLSLMYPFSPVLNGSMALMVLPDMDAVFLSPNVMYSLATNLDVQFVSQLFRGSSSSLFSEAGSAFYLVLKWSF